MIALLMVIVSHSLVVFAMRFTEVNNGNRYAATVFTYIIGAVISFIMMDPSMLFSLGDNAAFTILMGAYNGICMTFGMLLCRLSMGINGTSISTTFNRLGVLIPTIAAVVFFGERPEVIQIVGIAIAIAAIIYINSGKESKENSNVKSLKLLIVLFLVGGTMDLNTKIFNNYGAAEFEGCYQFISFISCIVVSTVIMLAKERKFTYKEAIEGTVTGIPNTFILYFSIKAVEKLPAYIVFPAYSAGVIFVVNIVNYFLFKEKLSKEEKIATVLVAIALILINI